MDLAVTSLLGMLLGIPSGAAAGSMIMRITEESSVQMVRTVDPRSVLFSALICGGFSLLINGTALRRIRHLSLTEIDRGNE